MKADKSFTPWMKKVWGDGTGVPVPPNLGGERVVRKKAPIAIPSDIPATGSDGGLRRVLLLGILAQPVFYFGAQTAFGGNKRLSSSDAPKQIDDDRLYGYSDGDAVSSPSLEIRLLDYLSSTPSGPARDATAASLTSSLEARGGSQIFASAGSGRWVLPWVGGWERVWTSSADAAFLGGPSKREFSAFGKSFSQVSARMYIYGPGEGGVTVEYLHAVAGDASAPIKVLLTRPGTVTNLGGNVFQLDFSDALAEYEVQSRAKGDSLLSGTPIAGGVERAPPASQLLVETSYLSERMWILRDARDPSKVAVFARTETRSVMDRRGLVAEGQLKPPDDETIRYGRLLFGETLQDYAGWDAQQAKMMSEKDKLLSK